MAWQGSNRLRTEMSNHNAQAPEGPPSEAEPAVATEKGGILIALRAQIEEKLDPKVRADKSRGELARVIGELVARELQAQQAGISALEQRNLVTQLLNEVMAERQQPAAGVATPSLPRGTGLQPGQATMSAKARGYGASENPTAGENNRFSVEAVMRELQPKVLERIEVAAAAVMPRDELERQLFDIVGELAAEAKRQLNRAEQQQIVMLLLDDMLGLGPLEPLLADETVTDIMVNGAKQIYIERRGQLELSNVRFVDNGHVMNVATRIVTRIGRRIDESSPLVDARLLDGSRVNMIIPPLAIDGPSISIRKFAKKSITLDIMATQRNMSPAMAKVLEIASRCRLNILISGGTGSGKTTLLNAMSRSIDHGERIVTIEDAAELQLQQPHVVRLETRPPNLEGGGEITMRDLVRNALRMRPDRIILGEIRGAEAIDMLQAMNTGHDGSMCTIHANRPRETLTRLENMVGMAGLNLPAVAIRTQITGAVHMIVQVSRMRDGIRRITHIMEVVGMEGDVITTQDLFTFRFQGEGERGRLRGAFEPTGLPPHFLQKAEYYGLDRALNEAIRAPAVPA